MKYSCFLGKIRSLSNFMLLLNIYLNLYANTSIHIKKSGLFLCEATTKGDVKMERLHSG